MSCWEAKMDDDRLTRKFKTALEGLLFGVFIGAFAGVPILSIILGILFAIVGFNHEDGADD
jgi:hypothetical protein